MPSEMAKIIRSLSHRHDTYRVFADACEMMAISLSNAVDKLNLEKREKRYMDIVKGYKREEIEMFPKIFGSLIMELEDHPRDVLGELFHELELHNEHAGQFFTPYHICKMMAKMNYDESAKEIINQKGYITVHEPACGSGAMVIAMAGALANDEINFQQCMHVTAVDIDSRCVHMAYTQFSLLHIPAVVYQGDTLRMGMHDVWHTPAHIMGGWDWRLMMRENMQSVAELVTVAEPPDIVYSVPVQDEKTNPIMVHESESKPSGKGQQLSLF